MMDYIVHTMVPPRKRKNKKRKTGARPALSGRAPTMIHMNESSPHHPGQPRIGYNSRPVLSGISLSIARASFTAILGVNGSGKSTLLKTILGLIPPVAGRIETAPSTGAPPVFGYVPQSNQFDPIYLLTGFEVALMGIYGRVAPGRFVPPIERSFTRECLRAAGAEEFAACSLPNSPVGRNNGCS